MPKPKLFIISGEPLEGLQAPNNLPVQSSRLIGREKEVEDLVQLLSEPEIRLLTLVGPGGVGKTRLALGVAQELSRLEGFEAGIYFVDLASIVEYNSVVPTLATTLQVREEPGVPLISTLKTHLQDKSMLLVLDNFEQVIQAASDMTELLAACSRLKLLVTSRAALGLRNEREFAVSPLSMPTQNVGTLKRWNVGTLMQFGAIELFAQRASTLQSEFELTEENAGAVVEICRRVDGLPLAIELVAAHARLLSPRSILTRLRNPLRLLTGGLQDAPDRHKTMRETIEWSYRLLDEEEQRLFRWLSVFVSGFEIRIAEAVCNSTGNIHIEVDNPEAIEVLEGLEALVDKSLLRRLEQSKDGAADRRLGMLETVREYAWEQLVETGEAEAIRRRHADYYLRLAEEAEPGLERHETLAWLDRLNRDYDNLRATMSWLLEQRTTQTAEDALRLLINLRVFWEVSTHPSKQLRWLEDALTQVEHETTPLRSRALRRGSIVARKHGDYPKARAWAEQALAVARELGDKRQITDSLNAVSVIDVVQGDYATARALMEETLVVYRELGVDVFIASTLNNLGEVASYLGNHESAEKYFKESLSLFTELGDKTSIMVVLDNVGYAAKHVGKYNEAREALLETVTLAQEIDARALIAAALTGLSGLILAEMDRLGSRELLKVENATRLCGLAAELLENVDRQLELLHQIEFDRSVATARERLGEAAFTRAWEEGRAMTIEQAMQIATQPGSQISGSRLRAQKKPTPDGLTAREYEVAGLVTQGFSNAEIAHALVLSERTVEMHVSNALRKLGLAKRAQLAAWGAKQGLAPGPNRG